MSRAVRIFAIFVFFFLLLFVVPKPISAQSVPTIISHQGRLLNASNQPVTSNVSVEFKIYDALTSGTQVWTETQSITPDSLGFYDTFLGGSTALPSSLPNPSYLQITIQSETLSPRLQFGSVPFAQRAANGVPVGYSILGDTSTAPAGYSLAEVLKTGDIWTSKASMPTARWSLAASTVNSRIYAIGGISSSGGRSSTVEQYNPFDNSWATKASMPTARNGLGTAVVNNKIYAIGGDNGAVWISTVEEYDPANDTWATKASMPTARDLLTTAAVNNKIYAIGGRSSSGLNVNEEYNPSANSWVTKASMPTGRYGLASAVVNNKIYAIGGSTGSTVEEYDPANDTWAAKASMPTARANFAAVSFNDRIYVVGNGDTLIYDPATNLWSTVGLAPMPTNRSWIAASAVNGRIYTLGGGPFPVSAVNEEYYAGSIFYQFKKN